MEHTHEHIENEQGPKEEFEAFNKLLQQREQKIATLSNQTQAQLYHDRVNIDQDFTNSSKSNSFVRLLSKKDDMMSLVGSDLGEDIGVTQEVMNEKDTIIQGLIKQKENIEENIRRTPETIQHADIVLVALHQVYSGGSEIKFTPQQMATRENIQANRTLDKEQTHMSGTTANDIDTGVIDVALRISKKSESGLPGFHISIKKSYSDGSSTVIIYDYDANEGNLSIDGVPGSTMSKDLAFQIAERITQAENATKGRSSIQKEKQQQGIDKRLEQETRGMG